MINKETVLVLDAGNTSIKIAVFQKGEIADIYRIGNADLPEIKSILNRYNYPPAILSSVLSENDSRVLSELIGDCIIVDQNTPVPIAYDYYTVQSLGIDRICNAVAISSICPGKKKVSIDIGTCVKFDFVNENEIYQGGSISPGINLRYKSLNDYTANLPLLNETAKSVLIGKSTNECIHSGVLNGIQAEINEFIQRYTSELGDLTFFMTGGDSHFFEIHGKNNIFVDENLTLKGLHQIYKFNAL